MNTLQSCHAHWRTSPQLAFTRTELTAMLAALALLAVVVLPALANTRPRAQRLTCVSNLREIGQGFASWSSEYGNRLPMQVEYTEGGTLHYPSGLGNNGWYQFAVISNHVRSPRIFACPSDPAKREALNFTSDFTGGFLSANYRNNALSYVLSHPMLEAKPDILAGDRHLFGGFYSGGCLYWSPIQLMLRNQANSIGWAGTNHPYSGNMLLSDGRVEQLSTAGLRRLLTGGASEFSGEFHYLTP